MPTRVIDIRKSATGAVDSVEYPFGRGTLKAMSIGSDANCACLAYLRTKKGTPEDCALIPKGQVSNLNDLTWSGELKVHKPLIMVAAFYGLNAGEVMELKMVIEV